MSQASSQAWAFYRDVAKNWKLWTVCDAGGYPCPVTSSGKRAQPFWSSLSRVERIIKTVPAYAGFEPEEVSWEHFCAVVVPYLTKDDLLAGVNWSGSRAVGYDMEAERLRQCVEAIIEQEGGDRPINAVERTPSQPTGPVGVFERLGRLARRRSP